MQIFFKIFQSTTLGIIDLRFAMDDRHFSPKQDNMERNVV
jgi:hypothetical protein